MQVCEKVIASDIPLICGSIVLEQKESSHFSKKTIECEGWISLIWIEDFSYRSWKDLKNIMKAQAVFAMLLENLN